MRLDELRNRRRLLTQIILRDVNVVGSCKVIGEVEFLLVDESVLVDGAEDLRRLGHSLRGGARQLTLQEDLRRSILRAQAAIGLGSRQRRLNVLNDLLNRRLLLALRTIDVVDSLRRQLVRIPQLIDVHDFESEVVGIASLAGLWIGPFQRPMVIHDGDDAAVIRLLRPTVCEIPQLIFLNGRLANFLGKFLDFLLGAVAAQRRLLSAGRDCFASDARTRARPIARVTSLTRMLMLMLLLLMLSCLVRRSGINFVN